MIISTSMASDSKRLYALRPDPPVAPMGRQSDEGEQLGARANLRIPAIRQGDMRRSPLSDANVQDGSHCGSALPLDEPEARQCKHSSFQVSRELAWCSNHCTSSHIAWP